MAPNYAIKMPRLLTYEAKLAFFRSTTVSCLQQAKLKAQLTKIDFTKNMCRVAKTRRRKHERVRVVPYWNKLPEEIVTALQYIRGDIQVSTGRTTAVPLPRSSPLTRPPILPPEYVPPCRIPPYARSVIILGSL